MSIDFLKDGTAIYSIKCRHCKEIHYFTITREQYRKLQQGYYIQDVLHHLLADDRELFISGICGKCFDNLLD